MQQSKMRYVYIANTLTGTTKNEIFVAGAGNDTLIGNGGMDVFNAGVNIRFTCL
jgi:Ca2+-binding RTX toxin-like protein